MGESLGDVDEALSVLGHMLHVNSCNDGYWGSPEGKGLGLSLFPVKNLGKFFVFHFILEIITVNLPEVRSVCALPTRDLKLYTLFT